MDYVKKDLVELVQYMYDPPSGWYELSGDLEYARETYKDHIIYSFQGSTSVLDWLLNFILFKKKVRIKNYSIRVNYMDYLRSLKIYKSLVVDCADTSKCLFIGPSQGGAYAQIVSLLAYKYNGVEIPVLTAGSKRTFGIIGSKHLKKYANKNFLHLRNSKDIVPSVPPAFLLYKHYGKVRRFTSDIPFWKILRNHWDYRYVVLNGREL